MSAARIPEVNRALDELARDEERVGRQLSAFFTRLRRDPIAALELRFTEREGFVGRPFPFQGKILTGDVHLLETKSVTAMEGWTPREHRQGSTMVEPVGAALSPWGVMIAVKVSHDEPDFRLKLDWAKPSRHGPIYLVDPVNHQYLRLIGSSLEGEVVCGVPRTGVLVFERFTAPTNRFQLHFSGVSLTSDGSVSAFQFEHADETLPEKIEALGEEIPPQDAARKLLEPQVEAIRREFLEQRSGCVVAAVSLLGSLSALFSWFWIAS